MLLSVIAAVLVFGLLVLVHELGHFFTAKQTGMRVDEFAIGFGPKIFSIKRGETVYSLRAIPLGGFNDIAGMEPENNQAGDRGYCEKPLLSRMYVILAGSAMNLIMPIFIFWGIFFFAGVQTPSSEPILGQIVPGKAAENAGLMPGDRIMAINGEPVATWQEFVAKVQVAGEGAISIAYERGGNVEEAMVTPTYDKQAKRTLIGVMAQVKSEYPGFFSSLAMALERTFSIIAMMVTALAGLVVELSGAELAGPIGVAQMAGEMAQLGIVPLLNFTALLSLNLGIINLFPIPALDGGHFVVLILEGIIGKPLSSKALFYAQRVGITLLILLMLFATKNDIMRTFFGG